MHETTYYNNLEQDKDQHNKKDIINECTKKQSIAPFNVQQKIPLKNTKEQNIDHDYNQVPQRNRRLSQDNEKDVDTNDDKSADPTNNSKEGTSNHQPDQHGGTGIAKQRRNKRRAFRKICSNFVVYYANIRGIKSKVDSLSEIVTEVEPTILCLVETHMSKSEQIDIPGYKVYRSDISAYAGGILIGVKEKVSNVMTQILERKEVGQSLWLLMDNTRIRLRIGIIYAPQESQSSVNDLKVIYREIEDQAEEAKRNKEMLLVLGDFNCKIGDAIPGNDNRVSKGGRLLQKMVLKKSLTILNAENICNGLWTRVQHGKKLQKSVIDYMVVNDDLKRKVYKMTVDEEKLYGAYHKDFAGKKTHSDHNAILLNTDLTLAEQKSEKKGIMTRKSYCKYKLLLQEYNIDDLFTKGNIQDNYNKWSEAVQKAIDKSKVIIKKKVPCQEVRQLTSIKKRLRKELKNEKIKENRTLLKERINLIRNHIIKELKKARGNAIKHIVQNIKNKSNNGSQIWDLKKKINRKPRLQKALKSKEGKNLVVKEEIIDEYEKYYKELLKTKESTTINELIAETKVNSEFNTIKMRQENTAGKTLIDEKVVRKAIKNIKLKKAADSRGWKGEWLKLGGEPIVKSLTAMFQKIDTEKQIPVQWEEVIIQSIHKKKGSTLEETERGIFLTNIVSKIYENVKKLQNESVLNNMNQMQMAGRKKRSTTDNIILINSMIQYRKENNLPTYLLFADAVKCFDKLWLKDCILEMMSLGMDEQDAWMIYQLNRKTIAKVRTPVGETPLFPITEIVKQGTVFGPLLCCASSAKINDIGEQLTVKYGNEVEIGMPVFMDDINATGGANDARKGVRKLRLMEDQKKTTFGLKKTVILVIGKGKKEEINEEVRSGRVKTVEKKDYMGIMLNESGNLMDHIEEIDRKAMNTYHEIIAIGSPAQVSGQFLNVRLILFEKCLLSSAIYGLAAWGSITDKEINEVEKIHGKYLKRILQLPQTTPYAAMIMETGLWAFKERLKYTTMMLFHEIINSDNNRKSKEVLENQIKYNRVNNTIYGKVMEVGKETNIDVSTVNIMNKSKWKKLCKSRIIELMSKRLRKEMENKTKSRFVQNDRWGKKNYIEHLDGWIAVDVIKIRLNMWPLKMNYKKPNEESLCPKCNLHNDTTEHIVNCYSNLKANVLLNENSDHWIEVVKAFQQRSKDGDKDKLQNQQSPK